MAYNTEENGGLDQVVLLEGEVPKFWVPEDGDLNEKVWAGKDSNKGSDSAYILKIELIRFAKWLYLGYEIKKESRLMPEFLVFLCINCIYVNL